MGEKTKLKKLIFKKKKSIRSLTIPQHRKVVSMSLHLTILDRWLVHVGETNSAQVLYQYRSMGKDWREVHVATFSGLYQAQIRIPTIVDNFCKKVVSSHNYRRSLDLWLFGFTMVWERYIFSRNHTSKSEFIFFPRLVIYGMILSRDARLWPWTTHLVSHTITRANNLYTYQSLCTHTTILRFTFRKVLNKLHEVFNALL